MPQQPVVQQQQAIGHQPVVQQQQHVVLQQQLVVVEQQSVVQQQQPVIQQQKPVVQQQPIVQQQPSVIKSLKFIFRKVWKSLLKQNLCTIKVSFKEKSRNKNAYFSNINTQNKVKNVFR